MDGIVEEVGRAADVEVVVAGEKGDAKVVAVEKVEDVDVVVIGEVV